MVKQPNETWLLGMQHPENGYKTISLSTSEKVNPLKEMDYLVIPQKEGFLFCNQTTFSFQQEVIDSFGMETPLYITEQFEAKTFYTSESVQDMELTETAPLDFSTPSCDTCRIYNENIQNTIHWITPEFVTISASGFGYTGGAHGYMYDVIDMQPINFFKEISKDRPGLEIFRSEDLEGAILEKYVNEVNNFTERIPKQKLDSARKILYLMLRDQYYFDQMDNPSSGDLAYKADMDEMHIIPEQMQEILMSLQNLQYFLQFSKGQVWIFARASVSASYAESGDYEFHSDCRVIPLNQLKNKTSAFISFEQVKQIIPGLSEMLISPGGNWILLHAENQNWILKDVNSWKTIQEFDISWKPVMSESAFQEEANTWNLALNTWVKPK